MMENNLYNYSLYKLGMPISLMLLLLLCNNLWADEKIFQATYQANYAGLPVKLTRTLIKKQDESFKLSSEASNFFAEIKENSHFTKTDTGLFLPLTYQYKRKILGNNNKEKIRFDWDKKTAYYSNKKKSHRNRDHTIVEGILDPALYQIKLQYDLANQQEPLNYTFVRKKKIKNYRFKKMGTGKLSINSKQYEAIKVKRYNPGEDVETIAWLIPELNYLLGKLTHREKSSNTYEMTLSSFKQNSKLYQEFYTRKAQLEKETSIE